MLSLLEKQTLPKTGREEDNEDALYVGEKYIAVIDGSTSKTGLRYAGKTGGRLASELVRDALGKMDGSESPEAFARSLQQALWDFQREKALDPGVHLCATVVAYNVEKRQIYAIGDSQYMVDGKAGDTARLVDAIFSGARAALIHAMLAQGMTEEELLVRDEARELLLPLLLRQRYLENGPEPYGYPVVSTQGRIRQVRTVDVPQGATVVLATDGYPELKPTLAESEDYLRRVLAEDPLRYKLHPSTKGVKAGAVSYDDRTYVRFTT